MKLSLDYDLGIWTEQYSDPQCGNKSVWIDFKFVHEPQSTVKAALIPSIREVSEMLGFSFSFSSEFKIVPYLL